MSPAPLVSWFTKKSNHVLLGGGDQPWILGRAQGRCGLGGCSPLPSPQPCLRLGGWEVL